MTPAPNANRPGDDFVSLLDPTLYPFDVGFFLVLGLLFGSFFNVCIYRIPAGQALSFPGSHCYSCGTPIRWYDNLPVLSYLLLRGRCRVCRAPFSPRYALIELLTGVLFCTVFLRYGLCWPLLGYLALTGLLLIATFTDVDHWIIPDRITWGGAAGGVVLALVLTFLQPAPAQWLVGHAGPFALGPWWAPAANSLVGAAAGAGVLYGIGAIGTVVFRKPAMGLGDSKLLLMIGAFCGWKIAVLCIFLASVFGSVQGVWLMVANRLDARRMPLPAQPDAAATVEEMQTLLSAEAGQSQEATGAVPFTDEEKAVLARCLTTPPPPPGPRRHLKFGPHLALAAWFLMAFEKPAMRWIANHFYPGDLY